MSCLHTELPAPIPFTRTITVAAAALIDADGRIMLQQRVKGNYSGYWEFPGGKMETGETPAAALVRELKEELDITTCIACLQPGGFASHVYPDLGHVLVLFYTLRQWQGIVAGHEGQKLEWARLEQWRSKPNLLPTTFPLMDILAQQG